ncbi:hypothetical protein OG230_35905 [Streptomyces sp. NBC_00234]|uniref:hypothetical protein n=1 Tax=Streptomyces sp. NBC_00234 TaxID=2903638 RepID=UPI002E290FD4|nr:hypothetical protein [Streptomyces sp. NBC_00234]
MQPWSPSVENDLRQVLNEWDPIGVADEVQDEYECMLAPMLQRLRDGANETEIGEFLRHEVEEHFGPDPLGARPEAMAIRVIAWWAAVGKADGDSA